MTTPHAHEHSHGDVTHTHTHVLHDHDHVEHEHEHSHNGHSHELHILMRRASWRITNTRTDILRYFAKAITTSQPYVEPSMRL
jgi:hypothetical protein